MESKSPRENERVYGVTKVDDSRMPRISRGYEVRRIPALFIFFSSQESSSKDQSKAPEEAHSIRFASSITPLPSPELSTH